MGDHFEDYETLLACFWALNFAFVTLPTTLSSYVDKLVETLTKGASFVVKFAGIWVTERLARPAELDDAMHDRSLRRLSRWCRIIVSASRWSAFFACVITVGLLIHYGGDHPLEQWEYWLVLSMGAPLPFFVAGTLLGFAGLILWHVIGPLVVAAYLPKTKFGKTSVRAVFRKWKRLRNENDDTQE